MRAEAHRFLQATALIKLYQDGRLDELSDSPIDPRKFLTDAEITQAIKDYTKTTSYG